MKKYLVTTILWALAAICNGQMLDVTINNLTGGNVLFMDAVWNECRIIFPPGEHTARMATGGYVVLDPWTNATTSVYIGGSEMKAMQIELQELNQSGIPTINILEVGQRWSKMESFTAGFGVVLFFCGTAMIIRIVRKIGRPTPEF